MKFFGKCAVFSLLFALSACFFTACGGTEIKASESSDGAEASNVSSDSAEEKGRPGLYVEDGKLMRDGKEFFGIGINYLGLFYDALDGNTECIDSLETLAEYGVKCIRVPVNATYTEEVMKKQFDDEENWWALLDRIVAKAEEVGIGLICGFFWSEDVIPNYFGEEIAWSMREEESLSWSYMDGYIQRFIGRYGESEAIWGWEYGNEIMLEAQIPDTASQPRRFTCDDVVALYKRFVSSVKKYDKYNRFIGSGDAGLRASSYNIYNYNSWYADTKEEQQEMCGKLYPMDGVSWHAYADSVKALDAPENFVDPPEFADGKGGKTKLYTTWTDYFGYVSELAKAHGKIAYLGETAFTYPDSKREIGKADAYKGMEGILKAAYETDFPLTIVWNYDPLAIELSSVTGTSDRWGNAFSEQSERGQGILSCIKDYNRKIDEKHQMS